VKKFHFNLDALHKYRGTLEDMRMREFSEGVKKLRDGHSALVRLRQEMKRLTLEIDLIRESYDKRHELALYETYMADLKELIILRDEELKALKKDLELKRLALVESMKERKVLDVMREKLLEEHTAKSLKTEQKTMDDIASTMFSFGGEKDEK